VGGVTCRQLCRLRRRRNFTNKFLFTKRVWGLVKNRMEESDPDPAVAAGQRSNLLENSVRGEEQVVNAECNSSGMEIEFATWKGTSTGPSTGCSISGSCSSSSSISARTTISKFSTESENVKVYVKRKSRDAGGVHLFESPLKKQNVDSLAGGSKDAVLMVEPLRTPTSMPPLEAVLSETSQDMVVNVNNNNNNRQNVSSNQYVTTFPASVIS